MGAEKFSKVFRTITVDNGMEFSDFLGMEKSALRKRKARTKVYYCHAHRSCERGSNENANKLIRRHLPKGTDLSKVTQKQVAEIEEWIDITAYIGVRDSLGGLPLFPMPAFLS